MSIAHYNFKCPDVLGLWALRCRVDPANAELFVVTGLTEKGAATTRACEHGIMRGWLKVGHKCSVDAPPTARNLHLGVRAGAAAAAVCRKPGRPLR